jgi:hypothetical protein
MVSHYWGDSGVDWKGINDAADYLSGYCARWGRFDGQAKEKYGCVRFYVDIGWFSLLTLLFPYYIPRWVPRWVTTVDYRVVQPVLDYLFGGLIRRWQKFIYIRAYKNAMKKWPHLRGEILAHADYPEWIPGATKQVGDAVHILGWQGETLTVWQTFVGDADGNTST